MVEVSTLHNQAKVYRTEGKVTGVELKQMVGHMRVTIGKVRLQLLCLSFQFSAAASCQASAKQKIGEGKFQMGDANNCQVSTFRHCYSLPIAKIDHLHNQQKLRMGNEQ